MTVEQLDRPAAPVALDELVHVLCTTCYPEGEHRPPPILSLCGHDVTDEQTIDHLPPTLACVVCVDYVLGGACPHGHPGQLA